MKRTLSFLVLTALAGAAYGDNINICSTGFATATTSGCGAAINSPASNNLLADGNWYTASNSSGSVMGQAYVTVNNAYPVSTGGPWLANNANDSNGVGAGSSWIVPSTDQASNYINGQYYFGTQFSLTGLQASTASISGYWLADDYGSGIYLNGVSVGQNSLPAFGGLGGPMTPFNITEGSPLMGTAAFTGGTNTLVFGVTNDYTGQGPSSCGSGCYGTPTGVRVLFTDATASLGTPEPGTMFMMGFGLVALALLANRRRAKV